MKRGITVDIPNEYDNLLWKVLKPIDISSYDWWVGSEESYLIARGGLDEALFPEGYKYSGRIRFENII